MLHRLSDYDQEDEQRLQELMAYLVYNQLSLVLALQQMFEYCPASKHSSGRHQSLHHYIHHDQTELKQYGHQEHPHDQLQCSERFA